MDRQPVESENIASVGYDPDTQTLEVEFRHGRKVYSYENVPPEKYEQMMAGGSVGKHLAKHIIGTHAHTKVR